MSMYSGMCLIALYATAKIHVVLTQSLLISVAGSKLIRTQTYASVTYHENFSFNVKGEQ